MTRLAVAATGAMIFFLIIPPLALLFGLIAAVTAARAFNRSKRAGLANPTAQWCLMIAVVLMFLLMAGNILFSR